MQSQGECAKRGEELFLCWLENSQKLFILDLSNEPWAGFSSFHLNWNARVQQQLHQPCHQILNGIHFWDVTVSWLLFPNTISLNAIHIFNKLGITLDLALVTICAVVWAHYWGVSSAITTLRPTAHRVKGLLLRWCTESLTGVVILGRLSLPLQQGKRDTRACCVTWFMDMWPAPCDLWYHLHCLLENYLLLLQKGNVSPCSL